MSAGTPVVDREIAAITDLLTPWVPSQPWYLGSADEPVELRLLARTTLREADPRVEHLVVAVRQGDRVEPYQLPVSVRWDAEHRMEHVKVGQLRVDDEHRGWVYDALHDKDAMADLLGHMAGSDAVGQLVFAREADVDLPLDEPSTVLTHEHANTSAAFGDAALLKAFRRLQPGTNPDLEVHRELTHRGNTHVAPLYGAVSGTWEDPRTGEPQEGTLAMLKRFLVTATDGWQQAEASVRDLYAEADLHPHEVGGDFASEAGRLGAAVADVHADLRAALPTGSYDAAALDDLAAEMGARLDAALRVVEALAPYEPALREAFAAVASVEAPVPVQRIHGDLTLVNVLRTVVGWKLIDFEGLKHHPFEDRNRLDSPLRDLAAMRRSLDYAAQRLRLADHPRDQQIAYRAGEWAERNADAFLAGWAESPAAPDWAGAIDPQLLRAYELDQAVAEAVWEVRHRPAWAAVPLAGIERAVA